ncbi:MAG: energy-coupling factor transporter transmembrane protein EcfT [Treponema sp.]|nr:energy-coupling factor transporter transmembrane protein EcfT [Treponema sp.]
MSFFNAKESSFYVALDARTKLIFILLFTLLVFLIDKLHLTVCLLLFSAVIRFSAKIPFRGFTLFKNLTLLAAIIILMQMIFGPGETFLVKPLFPHSFPLLGGAGSFKLEGLMLGVILTCRLAALMIVLPVYTETTPAYKVSAGLCAFGLNYRTAFIITTAFNLIPVFRDEALVIMDAQKLRGMRSFEKGSIFSRIKAYTGLLIPLMLNAMRKAQVSSAAMDARAFGIYKTRTWIDKSSLKLKDYLVIVCFVVVFAFITYLNYR